MEALSAYVDEEVESLLSTAVADLSAHQAVPGREEILGRINKQKFVEFFNKYKRARGAKWAFVPSPYELKGRVLADLRQ